MADSRAADAQPGPGSEWPVPWEPVWGESARVGDYLSSWAVRGALGLTARLPERSLELLIRSVAALAHRLDRRRTRAAHEFLRQALGDLPHDELERRTRLAWQHLLRVTIDTQRFLVKVPPERVREHYEIVWTDDLRRVAAEKRGCILVGAHLGNWEAGAGIAPWIGLHPVYGVAKPPKNRPLSRAIQAERERRGIRILNRKGAMRAAPRILEAGGTIAMLLDQRTSGRSFLAPFFGRLARCDRSAGVLMQRHRVPILVGWGTRGPKPLTYRLEFPDVLWPEDWADAELEAIVARIHQAFEHLILAHPDQYVWIHDRYKDTPSELSGGPPRILRPGESPRATAPPDSQAHRP